MNGPTRLARRALVLGGLVAVAAVGLAQPASAHATVGLRTPGVGQQLTARGVTVSASVTLGTHPTGNTEVAEVDMTIDQLGTTRGPIRASAAPSGGNVSFPVDLPYNGRYKVTVSAAWSHTGLVLGDGSGTATDSREFSVAAPPASPTDVKAAVDAAARSVTLTWKANTEPDLLFYVVQRAKGTSNEFTVIGKANEPKFVDASTADAGGDYKYQVVAVRAGVTADEGISSDPSALTADSTAKVPDPPPPPTTAPPAGNAAAATTGTTIAATASGGGSTATTLPASNPGALTTSGTVDLKGFTSVQNQARRPAPRPAEVDTGFLPTLPFAPRTGEQAEEELEEGAAELAELPADSPQYRELGAEDDSSNRQETMAFFAAGLLVTVLLMHVLWVKSEVKRTPLEVIAPEGPIPLTGRDELTTAGAKPAKTRRGRSKATPDPAETEWFVPGLLDTDETPPVREKVGVSS